MAEEFLPQEKAPMPSSEEVSLENKTFKFRVYNIGKTPYVSRPEAIATGSSEAIVRLWDVSKRPPLITEIWKQYPDKIPYTFLFSSGGRIYGDYTTNEGMDEFRDIDVRVNESPSPLQEWAQELWQYARLKNPRVFARDEIQTAIETLEMKPNGTLLAVVRPVKYSQAFYSKGAENTLIGLSPEEKHKYGNQPEVMELNAKLMKDYPGCQTVREAIAMKLGHLPEYGERVYEQNLGVAGIVLTKDGDFVFVRRGANLVNAGINVTASGAVKYNKDKISAQGLQMHVAGAMADEAQEEIGLKAPALIMGAMQDKFRLELGVNESDYDLIPVGFARELPRGGSPEFMFLARYKGTTEDLVRSIANNKHEDRSEIDELVYAMSAKDVKNLIETKGASSVIQHKAILNLIFAVEFLKNHPWN